MSGAREQLGALAGRAIVVTGSTRGIGRGVAAELAAHGARVAVHGRDPDAVAQVADELGGGAVGIAADIATAAGAHALIAQALDAFGTLDGLVNNAGTTRVGPSLELAEETWRELLDLNLGGTMFCSQAAAAAMLTGAGGAIVNLASIAGLAGLPGRAAYATTKAGVIGLTRVLAVEWGPRVRVNAVAPGYVRTELIDELAAQGTLDLAAIERRVPAARLAGVDDVAGVVAFLLSDDARYVTGTTLPVDGGWVANGAA